ncbi:hypothetical protein T01_9795 [Trichinella spiralis]|uniref:Uncharacterized protein n=1 Tax=Trichinella spiralis TaxID=6334 RepID=A0A0V1C1G7_TRISP|nr:hypothetical protein T01_9795 [Trichinella spiralis]
MGLNKSAVRTLPTTGKKRRRSNCRRSASGVKIIKVVQARPAPAFKNCTYRSDDGSIDKGQGAIERKRNERHCLTKQSTTILYNENESFFRFTYCECLEQTRQQPLPLAESIFSNRKKLRC